MEKINFWRTKAGAEVDFVVGINGSPVPVEVKYTPFERNRISKSLASFIADFKPPKALVLTKNYRGTGRKDKTRLLFAPIYYF